MKKIRIRLLWLHSAQFSGLYYAYYFGLFAQAGVRPIFIEANPVLDTPSIDRFGGLSQFAIVSSTDVIKARDKNNLIRAVHVIVPENAICFMVHDRSNIKNVRDFKGKTIAYRESFEESDILEIMLAGAGMSSNDINRSNLSLDLQEFVEGTADAAACHLAVEPTLFSMRHDHVRLISAEIPGGKLFADTIVTNETTIRSMPHVVRAVVSAADAGWRSIKDNMSNALQSSLAFQGNYDLDNKILQEAIINHMVGLYDMGRRDEITPFGMAGSDWEPIIKQMHKCGLISKKSNPRDMYWC